MGIINNLIQNMRVNNDDYDEDDYVDDDEVYEEEKPKSPFRFPRRRDPEEEEGGQERPHILPTRKVTPVRRSSGMEVALVKPAVFDDAKEIVDDLLIGKAVVLNMEGINTEIAQRIIDFTSGATYSMNGKLQKISNYIFIITPENVNLSGEFQDLLSSAGGSLDISGLNLRV